ncbi:MAG: hypothetical protein QM747_15115 [Nocardioides sp.]
MTDQAIIHTCGGCGVERIGPGIGDVPGETLPCANDGCGSTILIMHATFDNDSGLHDEIRSKLRDSTKNARQGRKVDQNLGSEYYRKGARWHHVDRRIDYENDWYDEVITDEESREVVRCVHEPLSVHQGRGTAQSANAT